MAQVGRGAAHKYTTQFFYSSFTFGKGTISWPTLLHCTPRTSTTDGASNRTKGAANTGYNEA